NSFTEQIGKNQSGQHVSQDRLQQNDRKCRKRPWLIVAQLEHRPPALDANQQQQGRPGNHRPVNANPRPRQQNSAEPLQNLCNGETENDGNKNREITKLVHPPNCRASVSDAKLIKRRFKDSRQQRQNDTIGHSGGPLRSAAWVLCHLQFCAHDQPEKDDSEKRKQQPGKYGWDAPNKEQPNVGGTGGWKRRTQPELIAQHPACDIIKPRFIEATLIQVCLCVAPAQERTKNSPRCNDKPGPECAKVKNPRCMITRAAARNFPRGNFCF